MKALVLTSLLTLPWWFAHAQPLTSLSAGAELRDVRGQVVGEAELQEDSSGVVTLRVWIRGLSGTKVDEHGLHLHAVGACTPTFAAAGGHFNPAVQQHGFLNRGGHHVGDLPNLRLDADGHGTLEIKTTRFTLGEGAQSLFDADGSALVVHAGPDDYLTDPAGASGDRIACGVVMRGPRRALAQYEHLR